MSHPQTDPALLDLYKLTVEMADRTSARRQATNTFFVSLQSALAALIAVLSTVRHSHTAGTDAPSLLVLAVVGVVLSVAWWGLLRYYRRLNQAKFAVINAMEVSLPARPFTDEWAVLHPATNAPAGSTPLQWYQLIRKFKQNNHREATVVEQVVPIAFGIVYILLGVRTLTL